VHVALAQLGVWQRDQRGLVALAIAGGQRQCMAVTGEVFCNVAADETGAADDGDCVAAAVML